MELDSWATGTTQDRRVGTVDARTAIGALWIPGSSPLSVQPGLRIAGGDPGAVTATSTPGSTVNVNAFQGTLAHPSYPGPYIASLDATKNISILGVPAHASLQRNDLIIAQQSDAVHGDPTTGFWVGRIQGTPGAGDPAVNTTNGAPTNSPNYFTLARVRIPANATTITNSMIDDLRPPWTTSYGGIKPVRHTTERDALPTLISQAIYRIDRHWIEVCDGAGWRVQGIAICSSTADRNAAITHPYNGQFAYTTDNQTLWRYHNGWARAAAPGIAALVRSTALTDATTTETIVDSATITMVQGHTYEFVAAAAIANLVGASSATFRWRWASGGSISTAGTEEYRVVGEVSGAVRQCPPHAFAMTWVQPSGTYSWGFSIQSGANTTRWYGDTKARTFKIVDLG